VKRILFHTVAPLLGAAVAVLVYLARGPVDSAPIFGFTADGAAAQHRFERHGYSLPDFFRVRVGIVGKHRQGRDGNLRKEVYGPGEKSEGAEKDQQENEHGHRDRPLQHPFNEVHLGLAAEFTSRTLEPSDNFSMPLTTTTSSFCRPHFIWTMFPSGTPASTSCFLTLAVSPSPGDFTVKR